MNVPAIKKFCAALPHATGDIKWGVDQVYSIGGRMFCVAFVDAKKSATDDNRDADYNVATEKCESLTGDAKAACMSQAKMKYGKT